MFPESDRRIFTLSLAGSTLHYDPQAVWKRLRGHFRGSPGGDTLHDLLTDASAGLPEDGSPPPEGYETPDVAVVALDKLVEVSRAAFGLPAIDRATGQGYTDAEAESALQEFLGWEDSLKKASGPTPDGSPSTAGLPAGSASAPSTIAPGTASS